MGCVLFKKYFPTKSFGVWNGPRRVFSLFRHIRGIYVVTEKNNRLGKDLRRIKENNYRATDTNAIRNPKEVIAKKRKYGDTVNFCLISTFLFRIQLLKNNFKLKLSCLWVSCLKGGGAASIWYLSHLCKKLEREKSALHTVAIYVLSSVIFLGLQLRLCKKKDKYQVWTRLGEMRHFLRTGNSARRSAAAQISRFLCR